MPRKGHPRSLNDEKRGKIQLLIALGWKLNQAARYVGCASCTLRREVLRNSAFRDQIETSRQGFEAEMLKTMFHAAATKSEAARWLHKHVTRTDHVDPFSARPYNTVSNLPPPPATRARTSRRTSARSKTKKCRKSSPHCRPKARKRHCNSTLARTGKPGLLSAI
jgi:hypothetical protein